METLFGWCFGATGFFIARERHARGLRGVNESGVILFTLQQLYLKKKIARRPISETAPLAL